MTKDASASRACPAPFSPLQGAPARGHGDSGEMLMPEWRVGARDEAPVGAVET
jgi:hypothetical protein